MRPPEAPLLGGAAAYAHAWRHKGYAPPPGRELDLPHVGGHAWSQKARSLEALLEVLGPAEGRVVADVGAGTGWLSYRLSLAGFRCFATDISGEFGTGLGAAIAYDVTPGRFERALATLTAWPFQTASLEVAVCNASLHYLKDVRLALEQARRALRPGGVLVTMNDPVHWDPASAARAARDFQARLSQRGPAGELMAGHGHFVAADFEAALRARFDAVRRVDPDFGAWFRISRPFKGALLRMELASFPLYVAKNR